MKIFIMSLLFMLFTNGIAVAEGFESDLFDTSAGKLRITFIGHGTLMMELDGLVIHIDPWSQLADYSALPRADLILVTHEHRDHLDRKAIDLLKKEETVIFSSESCLPGLPEAKALKNYDSVRHGIVGIEAYPAYNLVHMRSENNPYHPKGRGNAYLLTVGDKRILIGADTENVPELKALKNIDVAFLPMNLPYTMTPEMLSDLALAMKPRILYPYHYGETDAGKLVELLKSNKEIEVRIRKMP